MRTTSTEAMGRKVLWIVTLYSMVAFIGPLAADEAAPPFAMAKKVKAPREGALIRRLIQNSNKGNEAKSVKRVKEADNAQIFVKSKPVAQAEKSGLPAPRYSKTIVNWSEERLLKPGPVTPSAESTKVPSTL